MKKNVYYLQCECRDVILSEFIEDGLKISLIPLNVTDKITAFARGKEIWKKLTEETQPVDIGNKKARKALKDETFKDWGYKNPFVIYNDKKWELV